MSETCYVRCDYVDYFDKGFLTVNKVYEVDYIDRDGDIRITHDDVGDKYFLSADQGTFVDAEGNPL